MGYRLNKALVFSFTFNAYMTYHCSRTMWSYIQDDMKDTISGYTEKMTGWVNFSYLMIYGVSMKILGSVASKHNQKWSVAIGSVIAGLTQMSLAMLGLSGKIQISWIFMFMMINGVAQSTGWPCLVAIMGNWFNGPNVGFTMGIWSGCTNFGDVIGLLLGSIVSQTLGWNFYYAQFITGLLFFLAAFLLMFIKIRPDESYSQHLRVEIQDQPEAIVDKTNTNSSLSNEHQRKINFFNAWTLPGVALYVLGYVALKGTFLGFLFWLPRYINNLGLKSQSSYIASMFDWGTYGGGIILGLWGDRIKMRGVLIVPCLIIATALMAVVKYLLSGEAVWYYFVIFGIGFFQGGPYNLISGAIAIELSNTPELKGNKQATQLVSAIIEGSGTIAGAILQLVIPQFGQDQLFLLFMLITCVGIIAISFIMRKELQRNL